MHDTKLTSTPDETRFARSEKGLAKAAVFQTVHGEHFRATDRPYKYAAHNQNKHKQEAPQ